MRSTARVPCFSVWDRAIIFRTTACSPTQAYTDTTLSTNNRKLQPRRPCDFKYKGIRVTAPQGLFAASPTLMSPRLPTITLSPSTPIGSANCTLSKHQLALAAAKKAVLRAATSVAELEFMIDCLKASIKKKRNLADKEFLALKHGNEARLQVAGQDIPYNHVRSVTTIHPFKREEFKRELEQAEANRKKANQKMKEAKQEMKEAKQEAEEARLHEETYYIPETLVQDAENREHIQMFVVKNTQSKKASGGRKPLFNLLRQHLRRGIPPLNKNSYAFAAKATNGVGKTHCSFLIGSSECELDPGTFAVSAYCGVSNGWTLSAVERQYVKIHYLLKDVLCTRVALALHHRANNLDSPWTSLSIKNTKILPQRQSIEIMVSAANKIMQEKKAAKQVVVFGVFDDVQELEDVFGHVVKNAPGGVAKIVFETLRELQLELATRTGVLFVGFGTGTLFCSMVTDVYNGCNIGINGLCCDNKSFMSLVGADTPHENKIITRMISPRVRLIGVPRGEWLSDIGDVSEEDAQRLLPSALIESPLCLTKFGKCTAFLGEQDLYRDQKFRPLDDYILMLKCVRVLTSFQCSPNHSVTNCYDLDWVGDALCAVLALATSAKAGPKVRDAIRNRNPWLKIIFGTGFPLNVLLGSVRIITLDSSATNNILPCTGASLLETANGMEENSLILFRCKASTGAPFDYIMVAKYRQPGGHVVRQAALFVLKHSNQPGHKDFEKKTTTNRYIQAVSALSRSVEEMTIAPPFVVTNQEISWQVREKSNGVEYITDHDLRLGGLSRAAFESLDD